VPRRHARDSPFAEEHGSDADDCHQGDAGRKDKHDFQLTNPLRGEKHIVDGCPRKAGAEEDESGFRATDVADG
jgi:hypothetical protein